MKVVIAIDSLKGSLTSMEAGFAIEKGIRRVYKEAEVCVRPLADGGEGTTDALIEGLNGVKVPVTVTGPLGKSIDTYYGYLKESNTAIIEMASAAGIILVKEEEKDPFHATTYGVGEMILDAMNKGCRNFIIGIGGSATNDGGVGMLKALGFEFYDENGADVGLGCQALPRIHTIKESKMRAELESCSFKIACDVKNPLCKEQGATYVFGGQKGVPEERKEEVDRGMQHYADVVKETYATDYALIPGTGAAGGLGFAFLSFLGAELTPGIELILKAIDLEEHLQDADIVITGEGRLDHQTSMGKAPIGVAKLAKKYHAKVIAFAGAVTRDAKACNEAGIDAYFPIVRGVVTLEEAMNPENARKNMEDTVEQVFRLL